MSPIQTGSAVSILADGVGSCHGLFFASRYDSRLKS
jgi:hypothetical protein